MLSATRHPFDTKTVAATRKEKQQASSRSWSARGVLWLIVHLSMLLFPRRLLFPSDDMTYLIQLKPLVTAQRVVPTPSLAILAP